MALRPVTRQSIPDHVFEQIMSDVLSGELAPGELLPSERRLAEVLGCPGRWFARRSSASPLPAWSRFGRVTPPPCGTTSVTRAWTCCPGCCFAVGIVVTSWTWRSCAAFWRPGCTTVPKSPNWPPNGAGPQAASVLEAAVDALVAEEDPTERQRAALTFWDHVVDAADSIVFRLMFNTLRATYEPALPALDTVMAAEVNRPELYRQVAQAITAGDPVGAKRAATELLEPATRGLLTALSSLDDEQ